MCNDTKSESKGFLVIGVGLSRTGTLSLMTALELLLGGKCYHAFKAYLHENELCEFMRGKYSNDDLKNFFLSNNYVAAVDAPFAFNYDRILDIFPDAKVILTVREPEGWLESIRIFHVLGSLSFLPLTMFNFFFSEYLLTWSDCGFRGWSLRMGFTADRHDQKLKHFWKEIGEGNGIKYFNQWIREVEASVPEEKLLKFNVAEGWEPLCRYLDVPVPDVPFPKGNGRETLITHLHKNKRRAWLLLYEFISIPLFSYGIYKLSGR